VTDVDLLAEGALRDKAEELLDEFIKNSGCPIRPAQVSGLRQLAASYPLHLKSFADQQRQRAVKRGKKAEPEVEFWRFLGEVCEGRPPKHPWSLAQVAEALLTEEERADNKRKRKAVDDAKKLCYPPFFQHFCAHYLYRRATKGPRDPEEGT
jgi:hypothetical protein